MKDRFAMWMHFCKTGMEVEKYKTVWELHYIHIKGRLIIQGLFGGLFATVEKVRPYMNKVLKFVHKV